MSLAIDFSKAFDTVPPYILLECLMESTLPSMCCDGSHATCVDAQPPAWSQRPKSGFRAVRVGVPNGSLISPCILNFFVDDYFHTADLHSSYADDITAVVSDHNVESASQRLFNHAADDLQRAADHGLQVSINKSNYTLFTSDTLQSQLDLSMSTNDNTFPFCQSPKILGVTLDTHFTLSPYIRVVADRAPSRLSFLKA